MLNRLFGTPLHAAFFCAVIFCSTFLAGCQSEQSDSQTNPQVSPTRCPERTTAIASVQGDKAESPLLGQRVAVRGIVTLIEDNRGFYIEEPGSDADEHTSNAIYIQATELPGDIGQGSLISVQGNVSELGEGRERVTALTEPGEMVQCSPNQALPITDVTLPLDRTARESLEGMRIRMDGTLVTTDVFQFGRGNVTLSGNGLQFVPTEVTPPGAEAADIISLNRTFALPVLLPEGAGVPGLLVNGVSVDQITGVVAHDDRGMRVTLQSISSIANPDFTPPAQPETDSIRVVGMNLHNYFNGDGKGFGFPTSRGAETAEGFKLQRERIGAAIRVLDPHVLAVMELENDGFGTDSAAQDFIGLARHASGKNWAVARPVADDTGGDMITVGIFYRSDRLEALGPSQTLTGPEFERSRQPQAQLFRQLPDGEKILIVTNHLKSKGSCPDSGDDADKKDGQGCWNPTRRASAQKMSAWARNVATKAGTDNILILGDMNAYRNEDPIAAIRQAGFTELMDDQQGQTYSFVFFGQHGTLDYAFSSASLLEKIQQAFIWHVNVAFPANMELTQAWLRFSDHDPVVVDIRLRQSSTSD